MSQNKTIVSGVDYENLNTDGAADSFYESLSKPRAVNDNRTRIGGVDVTVNAATPQHNIVNNRPIERSYVLKIKERVIVGVLYSISKGLLGEIFPVYLGKNTIGQSDTCDIVLREKTVSVEHAVIQTSKNDDNIYVTITDFNSMYGTSVNDTDARYEAIRVYENDIITIGQHYKFIAKLFDSHQLSEDIEFEAIADNNSVNGETDNRVNNLEDDFYRPSAKRDGDDTSHTMLY